MANYLIQTTPLLCDLGILILRLFIGVCFVVHGMGKLGWVGTGNMQGFAAWLRSLGIPFAEFQARMAMAAEITGGVMIAAGLFTRVGAVLCFFTMMMAVTVGHKGGGYLITNNPPGREYALNLAMICVVLFMLGPGAYSFDAFLVNG